MNTEATTTLHDDEAAAVSRLHIANQARRVAVTEVSKFQGFQIANRADVASPGSLESPGSKFLGQCRDAALELVDDHVSLDQFADVLDGDDIEDIDELTDARHMGADGCVPIYTYQRWNVFADLCAYNEDIEDYGDHTDMTESAGIALYVIADRVIIHMVAELVELATAEVERLTA